MSEMGAAYFGDTNKTQDLYASRDEANDSKYQGGE